MTTATWNKSMVPSTIGGVGSTMTSQPYMLPEGNTACFRPNCDLIDGTRGYTVILELPGVPKEGIRIELTGNRLHVYGFSPDYKAMSDKFVFSERSVGHFSRDFILPDDVVKTSIKTDYCNGLLSIYLPCI